MYYKVTFTNVKIFKNLFDSKLFNLNAIQVFEMYDCVFVIIALKCVNNKEYMIFFTWKYNLKPYKFIYS